MVGCAMNKIKIGGVTLKTIVHLPGAPARFLARRPAIMRALRVLARIVSCAMVLLLAAVWLSSALAAMTRPLLDIGRPRIGDAILAFASHFSLSPDITWRLAQALVGARLFIGIWLLLPLVYAAYERLRWGKISDGMLDSALFLSAIASMIAVLPVVLDPEPRLGALGELMLCVMASGLATFARGNQVATPRAASAPASAAPEPATVVNPSFPLPSESPQLP